MHVHQSKHKVITFRKLFNLTTLKARIFREKKKHTFLQEPTRIRKLVELFCRVKFLEPINSKSQFVSRRKKESVNLAHWQPIKILTDSLYKLQQNLRQIIQLVLFFIFQFHIIHPNKLFCEMLLGGLYIPKSI